MIFLKRTLSMVLLGLFGSGGFLSADAWRPTKGELVLVAEVGVGSEEKSPVLKFGNISNSCVGVELGMESGIWYIGDRNATPDEVNLIEGYIKSNGVAFPKSARTNAWEPKKYECRLFTPNSPGEKLFLRFIKDSYHPLLRMSDVADIYAVVGISRIEGSWVWCIGTKPATPGQVKQIEDYLMCNQIEIPEKFDCLSNVTRALGFENRDVKKLAADVWIPQCGDQFLYWDKNRKYCLYLNQNSTFGNYTSPLPILVINNDQHLRMNSKLLNPEIHKAVKVIKEYGRWHWCIGGFYATEYEVEKIRYNLEASAIYIPEEIRQSFCSQPSKRPLIVVDGKERVQNQDVQKPQEEQQDKVTREYLAAEEIFKLDGINKAKIFETTKTAEGMITQIPGLLQTYPELFDLSCRGYSANQCGYYAAHNAKIFADNPNATQSQLVAMLNDRKRFEAQTLQPGNALFSRESGQNNEYGAANLLGEEILQLIPQKLRSQVIIVGAGTDRPEDDDASVKESESKIAAFKARKLRQLVFILPVDSYSHWIVARVVRDAQGELVTTIVDSLGVLRTNMRDFADFMQPLSSENEDALEFGALVGYVGQNSTEQRLIDDEVEQLRKDFTERCAAELESDINMVYKARVKAIDFFNKIDGKSLKIQLSKELKQTKGILEQISSTLPKNKYVQILAPGIQELMTYAQDYKYPARAFKIADLCRDIVRWLAVLTKQQGNRNSIFEKKFSKQQWTTIIMQSMELSERFLGATGLIEKYNYEDFGQYGQQITADMVQKDFSRYLEETEARKQPIYEGAVDFARKVHEMPWDDLGIEIGKTIMLETLTLIWVNNVNSIVFDNGFERVSQLIWAMNKCFTCYERVAFEIAGFVKLVGAKEREALEREASRIINGITDQTFHAILNNRTIAEFMHHERGEVR